VLFSVAFFFTAASALGADITDLEVLNNPVPVYDVMTCRFDLSVDYDNPYDPEQVDARALITEPDNSVVEVLAFYYEPYQRELSSDIEVLTPTGEPAHWRVRFAPRKEGEHSILIQVVDQSGTYYSEETGFTSVAPTADGFVRAPGPRYLAFDDGFYYVPIGYNICWGDDSGSYFFDAYYEEMASAGGNWSRLWMTHFGPGLTIEWGAYHPSGQYLGLGRYSQAHAFRLDTIFSKAQELGIYIQIVLNQHSQFETAMWSSWADNPFNAANGGPCETSMDFFTNEEANQLYYRRIRYMAARYGAFRSVLSWELWNEVELIKGYLPWIVDPWQHEKRDYIRSVDTQKHLITTSYASPVYLFFQDLKSFDYNQRHMYMGAADWVPWFDHKPFLNAGVPLLIGEFGIGIYGDLDEKDPLGIHMHTGIWAALTSGYAGGAMLWWWDSYIHPNGLAGVLTAPKAFITGENMGLFTEEFQAKAWCDQARRLWATGIRGENKYFGHAQDRILLWVHDPDYGWWSGTNPPRNLTNIRVQLPINPGRYDIEFWDTWMAEKEEKEIILSDPPVLEIDRMKDDIAIKLQRIGDDDDTADDDTMDDDSADDDAVDDDLSDDDLFDDDSTDDDDAAADDDSEGSGQEETPPHDNNGCAC